MTTYPQNVSEAFRTTGEKRFTDQALTTVSKKRLWAGRIMGGFPVLFLIVDAGMKLVKPAFVVQASGALGFPESTLTGIGIALLVCTLLYLLPRTSFLGAVLLTGYLGGAVACNVRVASPLFNIAFPIVFAALLWGSLWLRDPDARAFGILDRY